MAESAPKTQKEKKPDYENMGTEELFFNTIFGEWQAWQKKRDVKKRAGRINEMRKRREEEEHEKERKRIASALGAIDPAQIENKKILNGNEKSAARAIWTMLWATPFIRSANKFDRRRESAKKTLWEPFTKKTLGDLFKNIGKKMMEIG